MSARNGSSSVASRVLVKVISEPSGDHDGPMSSLGWLVRLVSPLPSLFTAQISHGSPPLPPLLSLFWNTTIVLSGDQSGARSSPSKLSPVKIASFWPAGSIVTISHPLSLTPANAILVPSEDQAGWPSLVSGVLVRLVWLVPSASITQMSGQGSPKQCSLGSVPGLTKTILPSGEVV